MSNRDLADPSRHRIAVQVTHCLQSESQQVLILIDALYSKTGKSLLNVSATLGQAEPQRHNKRVYSRLDQDALASAIAEDAAWAMLLSEALGR